MEYLKLSDCADYSALRTKTIDIETYISTENMLPDKGGVSVASSLPDCKSAPKYEPNDILLSNIRPYFKKIWIANRTGSCSNDVLVVRARENVDARFLYYVLSDNNFFNYDTVTSKGTKMPRGSKNAIMKYFVPDVPLPTQRRIASILSTYDSLIENNTRRIRLLEQMAENLYKEWFVRFRFPGHETCKMVDGPLGKLPSGFDVVKMKDVLDYYIGGGWGEEELSSDFSEDAFVIRGADFPNIKRFDTSSCPHRYHKISNYKTRQLEDGDIVLEISGGTQEQPVGRTVFVNQDLINRFENGKVICASFCKLIRPKKDAINPYFLFFWLQYLYDTRIITRFQLQSTGLINFKFEPFLRQCNVMVPPKDLQEEFAKQIASIYREMNNLASSSASLTRQRDLLLPRLMSGQIEINE